MANITRAIRKSLMVAALLLPLASWAVSLPDAKAQGLVGEQPDGYLGAVQDTPEAQAVVKDINAKRKAAYQEIAAKQNLKVEDVEALAGEKAINKSDAGMWVKLPDGTWHKK